MAARPNILIVMPGQQRMDSLGCYGNVFCDTPHVDELARVGVRFDRAFTPYPICTPARASMWTGAYPHAHGVVKNVYHDPDAMAARSAIKTTVFKLLKEAGYTTAYVGKWHLGDDNPGAFDFWSGFNSQGGHWVDGRQSFQAGTYLPDRQNDEAVAFIRDRQAATDPWVMVQGFYPPHDPYTAPIGDLEVYRERRVPHAGYYAHNTALDRNLGRMVEALEATSQRKNTLILYFSDHGETFKYRDGVANKVVCHDEAIRIPFVADLPGQVEASAAVAAYVGLQDVTPTALDYADCPIPDWVQGHSLRPLLEGRATGGRTCFYVENDHRRHIVRGDDEIPASFRLHGPWVQRAVRTERWKLILSEDGKNFLYDLKDDREEELDIFAAPRRDNMNQFAHYDSHETVILELARLLKDEAEAIGADVGVRLGEATLQDPTLGAYYGPGDAL